MERCRRLICIKKRIYQESFNADLPLQPRESALLHTEMQQVVAECPLLPWSPKKVILNFCNCPT
jgi:hypothetical protein